MTEKRNENLSELLTDMFIAQLLLAGVAQKNVQKIVKVDIYRVSRIGKLLKKER